MVDFLKIPRSLGSLLTEFRRNSSRAHRDDGVAPARQVFDMLRLRFGPGKLTSQDYYRMRVYRRSLSFDEKRQFVSHRGPSSLRWKRYLDLARVARQRTSKSILAQAYEIVQLRAATGQLSASSYYNYRLFEDRSFSKQQKTEFIDGRIQKKLYRALNSVNWRALADDKLVFYSFMRGVGLPYPRLYGIYHSGGRFFEGVPCLSNAKALAQFLSREVPYPFFAKPISGYFGHGAGTVVAFDSTTDRLLFADGKEITVEQYVTGLSAVPGQGAIFQEQLVPHPVVGEICGDRLSTLRLILLLCDDGPAPLRAIWRIPVGRNMTDNLDHGRSGNLCAQLDLDTGVVIAARKGVGLDQTEIELHPDTGNALTGFAIPNWKETMELCAKAASLLSRPATSELGHRNLRRRPCICGSEFVWICGFAAACVPERPLRTLASGRPGPPAFATRAYDCSTGSNEERSGRA